MLDRRHRRLVVLACGLLLGAWLAAPSGAAAQIAAVVDEQGRTVYVNAVRPERAAPHRISRLARNPSLTPAPSARTSPDAETVRRPAPQQPVGSRLSFDGLVHQTAARAEVDPDLVGAVIQVESEYNPRAVSAKGAMGLMQLIPATAQRFGVADPFNPAQNVEGGVTYLRYLLDLFGGDIPLALAAYNAGENAVVRANGIPPFAETRGYVRKVTALYRMTDGGARAASGGRWPTRTELPPIYSYVDPLGVVHFTNE